MALSFHTTCNGHFIIDSHGIRSLKPVAFKTPSFEDHILKLDRGPTPKKPFSMTWTDLKISNPRLSRLYFSGTVHCTVLIPLTEDCDLNCSGKSHLTIVGDHPRTNLIIENTGKSTVTGSGSLDKVRIRLSDHASVSGFHVLRVVRATLTDTATVSLTVSKSCDVSKDVSGRGSIRCTSPN